MVPIHFEPEDNAVFEKLKSTGITDQSLRRIITQQWNRCCLCGHTIARGRPAFSGYDAEGNALLVGAECADRLSELSSPIYWTDQLDLSVDDSQTLWRYMDFSKFVAMLRQEGLYVPFAQSFVDKFEGAGGLASREAIWEKFYLESFRQVVTTPPPGIPRET